MAGAKRDIAQAEQRVGQDLRQFAAVCRVVRGLRGLRIGAIGARPAAFKTVRYSEKILEASGIAVEPVDLFEILGRVSRLGDDDADVRRKLAAGWKLGEICGEEDSLFKYAYIYPPTPTSTPAD